MNRRNDGLIALIVFLVFVGGIIALVCLRDKPKPPPPPPQIKIEMPDAEKVGERVGSSSAGFGKGFYNGFKKRLVGETDETDKKKE